MPIITKQEASGAYSVGAGGVKYLGPDVEAVRAALPALAPAKGYVAISRETFSRHNTIEKAQAWASGAAGTQRIAVAGEIVGRADQEYLVAIKAMWVDTPPAEVAGTLEDIAKAERKRIDPMSETGYNRLVSGLSAHMDKTAGKISPKYLKGVIDELDFDWDTATDAKLKLFSKRLNGALRAASGDIWAGIRGKLYVTGDKTGQATRGSVIRTYNMTAGYKMNQKDLGAIRRVTAAQSHYVSDFYTKQVAPALSEQARVIVRNGLGRGFGTDEIAKDLFAGLGQSMRGRELPYFKVVANAYVGKSRAYSGLVTCRDSGITTYFASSVLDEITTDFCFCAGTKVLTVTGETSIECISAGHMVIDGCGVPREVLATSKRPSDRWCVLDLESGRQLTVTPGHRLMTNGGWSRASTMHIGRKLVGVPFAGGAPAPADGEKRVQIYQDSMSGRTRITKVAWMEKPGMSYNLEVDGDPTYIAEGVLVHNCRWVDGRILEVEDAIRTFEQVDAEGPESVKELQPWYRERRIKGGKDDGKKGLFMPQPGNKPDKLIAAVDKSGLGTQSKGSYSSKIKAGQETAFGVGNPPYHGSCVSGMSEILTKGGYIKARDLREGDLVFTHMGRWRAVGPISSREYVGLMIKIHGYQGSVYVTADHPVPLYSGEVVTAEELYRKRAGYPGFLTSLADGEFTFEANMIEAAHDVSTVYSFEVEEDKTFTAGGGVLLHNCRTIVIPDVSAPKVTTRRIPPPPRPQKPPVLDPRATATARGTNRTFEARNYWGNLDTQRQRGQIRLDRAPSQSPQAKKVTTWTDDRFSPPVFKGGKIMDSWKSFAGGATLGALIAAAGSKHVGAVRSIQVDGPAAMERDKLNLRLRERELRAEAEELAQIVAERLEYIRLLRKGVKKAKADEAAAKVRWDDGEVYSKPAVELIVGKKDGK